jgi:hypothetical protein
MGYNFYMAHKSARALRVVTPFDRATPESFYDSTIDHAWRLALALQDGDANAAADAVVAAYRRAWLTGRRDSTALLGILVEDARRVPGAVVLPLTPRPAGRPPLPA